MNYKSELENLDIHMDIIMEKNNKKSKINMDLTEYSYTNSIRRIKFGQIEKAMKQVKETIEINPYHFNSISNLACLYEMQKNYELACKWLEISNKIQPNNENICLGFALCYCKMGKFIVAK